MLLLYLLKSFNSQQNPEIMFKHHTHFHSCCQLLVWLFRFNQWYLQISLWRQKSSHSLQKAESERKSESNHEINEQGWLIHFKIFVNEWITISVVLSHYIRIRHDCCWLRVELIITKESVKQPVIVNCRVLQKLNVKPEMNDDW